MGPPFSLIKKKENFCFKSLIKYTFQFLEFQCLPTRKTICKMQLKLLKMAALSIKPLSSTEQKNPVTSNRQVSTRSSICFSSLQSSSLETMVKTPVA